MAIVTEFEDDEEIKEMLIDESLKDVEININSTIEGGEKEGKKGTNSVNETHEKRMHESTEKEKECDRDYVDQNLQNSVQKYDADGIKINKDGNDSKLNSVDELFHQYQQSCCDSNSKPQKQHSFIISHHNT